MHTKDTCGVLGKDQSGKSHWAKRADPVMPLFIRRVAKPDPSYRQFGLFI